MAFYSSQTQAKIQDLFQQAIDAFHQKAGKQGLEILKGYVPYDTRMLQKSLQVKRMSNNLTVVSVPNGSLFYPTGKILNARDLALLLHIPVVRQFRRSHSNLKPHTRAGEPTAGWLDFARREILGNADAIGAKLLEEAINKSMKEFRFGR